MPRTTNAYDAGGGLSTTMEREGVDIGPAPDFYGDLEQIRKRLKPNVTPSQQAAPLRASSFGGSGQPATAPIPYDPDLGMRRTSRSYGTPSISQQGVLGTYVNPLDVPVGLQGQVKTGFYTDDAASNYGYSPNVGPRRYGME